MRIRQLVTTGIIAVAGFIALSAHGATPSNPADPSAPVAATPYVSAFAGYQAYQEQQPGAWREQNDEVRGGGHAGHAQQATPSAEKKVPVAPGMPDHGAHGERPQ